MSPRSARVLRVLKQPGDVVVVGDAIAVMDAPELLGELAVARALLLALQSGVVAKSVDVREADREAVMRLGQDLERAAVDTARFNADLQADRGELSAVLEQLKRQEGLIFKGLATTTELERLSLKKSGLEQKVSTSAGLVDAARTHEEQCRGRLQAFVGERKRPTSTTKPEERVAPAHAEAETQAARVQALDAAVAALTLRAPVGGWVATVPVVGSTLGPNQIAVTMVSSATPTVTIYAEERFARRIAVGDEVVLRPRDHASADRSARVRTLSPLIAESPQRFRVIATQPGFARVVIVDLSDDGPAPFPGMAFDAHFKSMGRVSAGGSAP